MKARLVDSERSLNRKLSGLEPLYSKGAWRFLHGRLVSITSRSINRSADPSFSIVRDHSQQQSFLVEGNPTWCRCMNPPSPLSKLRKPALHWLARPPGKWMSGASLLPKDIIPSSALQREGMDRGTSTVGTLSLPTSVTGSLWSTTTLGLGLGCCAMQAPWAASARPRELSRLAANRD